MPKIAPYVEVYTDRGYSVIARHSTHDGKPFKRPETPDSYQFATLGYRNVKSPLFSERPVLWIIPNEKNNTVSLAMQWCAGEFTGYDQEGNKLNPADSRSKPWDEMPPHIQSLVKKNANQPVGINYGGPNRQSGRIEVGYTILDVANPKAYAAKLAQSLVPDIKLYTKRADQRPSDSYLIPCDPQNLNGMRDAATSWLRHDKDSKPTVRIIPPRDVSDERIVDIAKGLTGQGPTPDIHAIWPEYAHKIQQQPVAPPQAYSVVTAGQPTAPASTPAASPGSAPPLPPVATHIPMAEATYANELYVRAALNATNPNAPYEAIKNKFDEVWDAHAARIEAIASKRGQHMFIPKNGSVGQAALIKLIRDAEKTALNDTVTSGDPQKVQHAVETAISSYFHETDPRSQTSAHETFLEYTKRWATENKFDHLLPQKEADTLPLAVSGSIQTVPGAVIKPIAKGSGNSVPDALTAALRHGGPGAQPSTQQSRKP